MITNPDFGTQIDEIAKSVYRITTPVPPSVIPGGFSFNQYLLASDEPLLFHTGPRKMFALVREAIEAVVPVARLAYIGLSHFEADECGAMNDFLAVAPQARPLCGRVAAMVSVNDVADRPAHVLGDGDTLALGSHRVRWFDAPHLPHAWECGYLFEESTATLFCGDLFTQPGADHPPLTRGDILEPSEAFRGKMDYYSHTKNARTLLDRLASTQPRTLACMHGSAWEGDGAGLLRALAARLDA
ncbi:MAG TPA: MBL fold metallo-hydrolase [Candidatus Krumholzibacteria bacterium]|nr:MBL fold metallo-hydrolase [Candidatus Krumholzibacteria bacterium]